MNKIKLYRRLRGGIWIKVVHLAYDKPETWVKINTMEMFGKWFRGIPFSRILGVEVYGSVLNHYKLACILDCCKNAGFNMGELSDGYHTFNELYEHRNLLFIRLINNLVHTRDAWKSKSNYVGTQFGGFFVAGISDVVTYHIPLKYWELCKVPEVSRGKWNGHNSNDVLYNLEHLDKIALKDKYNQIIENTEGYKPKPHIKAME
jgi:hypothetical protein